MDTTPAPHAPPSIRDTLLKAAKDSKLTLEELSEKSGVSRKTMYSFFKGDADPRLSTIEALGHALGVSILAAPKVVEQLQLHRPPQTRMSEHSKIGRFLARHGQS